MKLTHFALTLALLAGSLNAADCTRIPERGPQGPQGVPGTPGAQGPRGPRGPRGPAGAFAQRFAAAHNDAPQVILQLANTPVLFPIDNFTPVGIVHPVAADTSQFQVLNTGLYLITWTMTVAATVIEEPDVFSVRLFNVSSAITIPPDPAASTAIDFAIGIPVFPLSGQTIVPLAAGTIVQLRVDHTNPAQVLTMTSPTFTITEISN